MLKKIMFLLPVFFCLTPIMLVNADNFNPVTMTYEGLVNPSDAINVSIYKPVSLVPVSGGYIVFSKAVDVDRLPTYIAAFIFKDKAIVITYYFNKKFYQVALPSNEATHLEMVETTYAQQLRYQGDFENVFKNVFPLR